MSGVMVRLARVTGAIGVLALTAGAVVLQQRAPGDEPSLRVADDQLTVAPAAATVVCPGAPILPDRAGLEGSTFDPVPVPPTAVTTLLGSGPADVLTLGSSGGPGTTVGALTAAHPGLSLTAGAPTVIGVPPQDGGAPLAAGTTTVVTPTGDLRGLMAASCPAPRAESWLVGGATSVGTTATLVVANAAPNAAEVTVTVWGPDGAAGAAAGTVAVVAPGTHLELPVGGIAPDQRRIVVRVQSTGAAVASWLQVGTVDGLTPAGVELVVPGSLPATTQQVVGLVGQEGLTGTAVLRLLAPTERTVAHVVLVARDGRTVDLDDVDLTAGLVTDVPLGPLPAGEWAVTVTASVPVVAGGTLTQPSGAQGATEVAWVPGQSPSATGPSGTVLLPTTTTRGTADTSLVTAAVVMSDGRRGATDKQPVQILGLGPDGSVVARHDLAMAGGETMTVPVADLGAGVVAVRVLASGELTWAVPVTTADGMIAVLAPVAQDGRIGTVAVRGEPWLTARG